MSFLDTLLSNRIKSSLPMKEGIDSLEKAYAELIEPFLPDPKIVFGWNQLLTEYIKQPDCTLFVRKYRDGDKEDGYLSNRGGFYSRYPSGFGFAFTDNSLAQAVYALTLNGVIPELGEWTDVIRKFQLPVMFRTTSSENQLRAFIHDRRLDPQLNLRGFKLCHLIGMGKGIASNGATIRWMDMFPRGERSDWSIKNGVSARRFEGEVDPITKSNMIANFIRFIHPANHFLGPLKVMHTTPVYKDFGEYPPLLDYVAVQFQKRYARVFDEFLDSAKAPTIEKTSAAPNLELATHPRIPKEKASKAPKVASDKPTNVRRIKPARPVATSAPSSNDVSPKDGDLVILVRPQGTEEGYANIWEKGELKVLAAHKAVVDRIAKQTREHGPTFFIQTAPSSGKPEDRMIVGQCEVAEIQNIGDGKWQIKIKNWIPLKQVPAGRSYGASYYVVAKEAAS